METSTGRVTIVVGARESFVHTKRSLESLYAATRPPFKLVYLDAGSPPWIKAYLQREAVRRGFELVRYPHFLTPNESRNRGFAHVETEFAVFADNDVLFADGWLEALVACADEENAAVVVPTTTIGSRPFTLIHSTGGFASIEETPAGRSYKGHQRHVNQPLSEVAGTLRRERVDNVELHCFLARTSVLRTLPPFDEALTTTLEIDDFGLSAAEAGATMFFEPKALVNQLLPLPLPRGVGDAPFLLQRWSRKKSVATVNHFARKWNIRSDSQVLEMKLYWTGRRRRLFLIGEPLFNLLQRTKRFIGVRVPRRRRAADAGPVISTPG